MGLSDDATTKRLTWGCRCVISEFSSRLHGLWRVIGGPNGSDLNQVFDLDAAGDHEIKPYELHTHFGLEYKTIARAVEMLLELSVLVNDPLDRPCLNPELIVVTSAAKTQFLKNEWD